MEQIWYPRSQNTNSGENDSFFGVIYIINFVEEGALYTNVRQRRGF